MTIEELADALDERSLTLTIHDASDGGKWVVWLHATDDPAQGVWSDSHAELERAIKGALRKWDR